LLRVARLNVFKLDSPTYNPVLNCSVDVSRTIVTTNYLQLSAPRKHMLELSDHMLCWPREVRFFVNGLSDVLVNHIEQPAPYAVFKLVMHKAP
jgi:hypothetical protein